MKRRGLLAVGLAMALALQGCWSGAVAPEPCVGSFAWHAGSMPPPYSSNWLLRLNDDGSGDFVYSPSWVEDDPVHEESGFDVDPKLAQQLCDVVRAIPHDMSDKVGGPRITWDLNGDKGRSSSNDRVDEAMIVANRVIGDKRMREAEAAFKQWQDAYEQ